MGRSYNGLMKTPSSIRLHRKSRLLEVGYADGTRYELPCEYLRVYSPSAEVRGHSGGETVLVPGKRNVAIDKVEPVGSYAVRLTFDDGHNTGLYTWAYLHELGTTHAARWQQYLERLQKLGIPYPTRVAARKA